MEPTSRLGRLKALARNRPSTPDEPEIVLSPERAALEEIAHRIDELGVVDLEFYEALTGRSFESDFDAAVDYLESSDQGELSLSPLIEPVWLRVARRGSKVPWYDALSKAPGVYSTSPVFDPISYRDNVPEIGETAKRTIDFLRHFLEHATESTIMPLHPDVLGSGTTWGEYRSWSLDKARRDRDYGIIRKKRWRLTWEEDVESTFRDEVNERVEALRTTHEATVSVVLPTKDRLKKLAKAVHSVQHQSYVNWELLVIDDGSTDGTDDYLKNLVVQDDRVKIVSTAGTGVAAARNAGLEAASGEFIAFLDSDNTWRPDHLLLSLAGLAERGARSSHSGLRMVNTDEDGNDYSTYRGEQGSYEYLLAGNFVDMNVLVLERSLLREIGPFDESLERWVDYDLVLRLAAVELPVYLPFLALDYDNRDASDRISVAKPMGWQDVVLSRHLMDWQAISVQPRVKDRLSIVIPTWKDWRMTWRTVQSLIRHSTDHDVEIVVLDNGSSRTVFAILERLFADSPVVKAVRAPRNLNFALGSNYGFAHTSGDTIMMLNNDTEVTEGWLDDLLTPLDDPNVAGVQPLLLYPDGTVQAAGTIYGGEHVLPWHFLAGHPLEDVLRADVTEFSSVTAAALVMRASDFIRLEGFDPIFTNGHEDVDFCLRAIQGTNRQFRVVHSSVIYHYESQTPGRHKGNDSNRKIFDAKWGGHYPQSQLDLYERAGLLAPHYQPIAPLPTGQYRTGAPVVIRPSRTVETGPLTGSPSLRWAIKTAAHAGERGRFWGDTIYARDLRNGLESIGQEVVVDPRLSWYRPSSYLDNVVLVLRGLEYVEPQPGAFNILWIISHPELVTDEELFRFDLVYCASPKWAQETTERTGRTVLPLLQATNPDRFFVDETQETKSGVAFVGTTRNEYRPIVRSAIDAGVTVDIYGPGWDAFVPEEMIKADRLSPEEVGAAYRASEIVLADHWADMAEHGFISNRIFDAVASGTVVVSDYVDGIDDVFGSAVRTVADPGDVGLILQDRTWLPSRQEVLVSAKRITEKHSFHARAVTLLQAVLDTHTTAG